MVSHFKFGKKKTKETTPSNTPSRDTSFSSPASTNQAKMANISSNIQNSPHSSNHSVNSQQRNTLAVEPNISHGIQYDHNNNLKSPQRPQQQANYSTPRKTSQNNAQFPQQLIQPWSKAKLLISPFPRYRHTASTIANEKGEIFVMGGLHNTSVYGDTWLIRQDDANHFQTLQVEITENSPAPRVGHASTTCGNAYVIFGGDTVSNQDGEIDNDLYLFNMNSHTWSVPKPIAKKPSGRYGHKIGVIAITNYDSKVYLFGGQLDDNIFDDLVVFNLSSFRRPDVQWEWIIPKGTIKPSGLTNHTMDVYENKLWVFGGFNGKSLTNDLWCYDPISNSWSLVNTYGTAPPPLEEHASVIYKGLLIIHGGKKADGEASRDLFFYSFGNKSWFKLPSSFSNFPGKFGHTISILKGDQLVLLGGQLPDYAKIGEIIEPTMDDHGVGTILNILDLSNLNKLIPGLQPLHPQEPLTPNGGGSSERFNNQPDQRQSLQSPVALNRTLPQAKAPVPAFKGHQRAPSAEDIFKREHQETSRVVSHFANNVTEEESLDLTGTDVEDAFSQESPLKSRNVTNTIAHPAEEELPLELPSPVITNQPVQIDENLSESVKTNKRNSSIIDNSVTEQVKNVPLKVENKNIVSTEKQSSDPSSRDVVGTGIVSGVVASTAAAVATAGGLNSKPSESLDKASVQEEPFKEAIMKSSVVTPAMDSEEKKEFKDLIKILSTELDQLKSSTTQKIKEASDKITELEEENQRLKSKSLPVEPVNENEILRRNHRLNSEYSILSQSHADLQAQYQEMKPIFTENLIDLSKLNEMIREQSEKISLQQKQIEEQENWKVKFEELQVKFYDVENKNIELKNLHNDKFFESQGYIKQLNIGLDSFLEKYIIKNEETGSIEVKEISPKSSITGINNTDVVQSLRSEIESLIADNEAFEAKTNTLSSEIEHLQKEITTYESTNKSLSDQLASLKTKEDELTSVRSKLTELDSRYKDSLHSVMTSAKALKLSESELSKQRDLNKTLLNDLEEIKLKKSSSRNITPIINDFKKKQSLGASGLHDDLASQGEEEEEDDDDFENSHFNFKIRDLQAELYIMKQERDELKENVLKLKKDLFIASQKKN